MVGYEIFLLVVGVLIVVALAVWWMLSKKRSDRDNNDDAEGHQGLGTQGFGWYSSMSTYS